MIDRRRPKPSVPLFNSFVVPNCDWAGQPCTLNTRVLCTDQAHACICSTTSYLLRAACEYCTSPVNFQVISWERYRNEGTNNCGQNPEPFAFDPPLPSNLTFPPWIVKYEAQVPSPIVTFDQPLAQSIAEGGPAPGPTGTTTASESPGISSTSEGISTPLPSDSPSGTSVVNNNASSSRSRVPTSAIAGAIVGGFICFAIIILLLRSRRRQHRGRTNKEHIEQFPLPASNNPAVEVVGFSTETTVPVTAERVNSKRPRPNFNVDMHSAQATSAENGPGPSQSDSTQLLPVVFAEVDDLRRQNEMLTVQIQELVRQAAPPQAVDEFEEGPPGYVA